MPSTKMFMSPRVDLTIRNLTVEQVEAISNAAVDIVGGVVSFSESAIYESKDTTDSKEEPSNSRFCGSQFHHTRHDWIQNGMQLVCPGPSFGQDLRV